MIFNLLLIIAILTLYVFFKTNKYISSEKKEKYFLITTFILFFILVGFRELTVGNDTPVYLSFFKSCNILMWDAVTFDSYYEGGYIILNVLINYISNNSRIFLLIMSLIFNLIIGEFIKENSKNYLLSILMYVCLLFFYSSMTMMRQFCALCIVLHSFKYIKQQKIIPFLLLIIFGSFFHSSVWVALLLYPLFYMKHNIKNVVFMIMVALLSLIFLEPIIDFICNLIGRENYYLDRFGSNNIANILYTATYGTIYLFCCVILKNKSINQKNFYLNVILVATLFNFIAINMNILARASLYFEIFSIIVLPNVITVLKNKDNVKIVFLITLAVLFLYSTTIIVFRPEWNSAFNYKSCLIHNEGDICE